MATLRVRGAMNLRASSAPLKTNKPAKQSRHAAPTKQTVGAGVAAMTLAVSMGAANAATIKLGGDNGELAFVPNSITVKTGEKVDFVNNAGFPHNVVFDEDGIPGGVNADKLSHEDYLNAPGQTVSNTFDTPGEYNYYCEPHQGAGMQGKIIVQ